MIREFRAMGTDWWVSAHGAPDTALDEARAIVEAEEQRFSRFRRDSSLTRLNRERELSDPTVAEVVARALQLRDETGGAFDPALGEAVRAAGYDRPFEEIAAAAQPVVAAHRCGGRPRITVCGASVRLKAGGLVDLGGIVKGWTADVVGAHLTRRGADRYVVDAGGDILVGGCDAERSRELIEVGDGLFVGFHAGAIATSTTLLRRWPTEAGPAHHIIAPGTERSARGGFETATVIASDAATADALATAVVADRDRGLAALGPARAEALACDAGGQWVMTPGFERWLR